METRKPAFLATVSKSLYCSHQNDLATVILCNHACKAGVLGSWCYPASPLFHKEPHQGHQADQGDYFRDVYMESRPASLSPQQVLRLFGGDFTQNPFNRLHGLIVVTTTDKQTCAWLPKPFGFGSTGTRDSGIRGTGWDVSGRGWKASAPVKRLGGRAHAWGGGGSDQSERQPRGGSLVTPGHLSHRCRAGREGQSLAGSTKLKTLNLWKLLLHCRSKLATLLHVP